MRIELQKVDLNSLRKCPKTTLPSSNRMKSGTTRYLMVTYFRGKIKHSENVQNWPISVSRGSASDRPRLDFRGWARARKKTRWIFFAANKIRGLEDLPTTTSIMGQRGVPLKNRRYGLGEIFFAKTETSKMSDFFEKGFTNKTILRCHTAIRFSSRTLATNCTSGVPHRFFSPAA